MFLVLLFVYFLSLHPWDTRVHVSVVYLYYFYLCTLGHTLYACLRGFFLLFYFLFFFAPQQPVSTSRHTLRTPRHVFQTPSSLFRPPTTPTHMFWPSMTPSHVFTGTPGPKTHVQAIVGAFLLLFIFFWLWKCAYEQLYMRFWCFYLFYFILFHLRHMYDHSYTHLSYLIYWKCMNYYESTGRQFK